MKSLTLGAGHLWVLMSPWRMDVKWYMKCFIYWTADLKYMKHFIYHFKTKKYLSPLKISSSLLLGPHAFISNLKFTNLTTQAIQLFQHAVAWLNLSLKSVCSKFSWGFRRSDLGAHFRLTKQLPEIIVFIQISDVVLIPNFTHL